MDRLREMEVFLEVVKYGSLSAAARSLGVAPPSVFRYINDLELQLKAKLINRSTRSLSLTEAGQYFHERIQDIVKELQETSDAVAQFDATPRGTLHVYARDHIGIHYIQPALMPFLKSYPELNVILTIAPEIPDLSKENIDVAIWSGELRGSDQVARKLHSGPRVVCAGPGYLADHGRPQQPGDLAHHNCISFRFDSSAPVWAFRKASVVKEVKVKGSIITNSGEVIRAMALNNAGVALLPRWAVSSYIKDGRLETMFDTYDKAILPMPFTYSIYAIYPPNRRVSPKVRLFLDHMAAWIRDYGDI